jgi:hypothetical protein
MLISIVEAQVTADHWTDVAVAYDHAIRHHLPAQLKQTFLIQDKYDMGTWRIISFWSSEDGFNEAHQAGTVETCMQIFRSVGSHPTRRVFDCVARHEKV